MAKELSELSAEGSRYRISTKFPTDNFTVAVHDGAARRVQVNGMDLRQVRSRRDFRSGTYLVADKETFVAFDLKTGDTTISMSVA
jgi:hypothetical protein